MSKVDFLHFAHSICRSRCRDLISVDRNFLGRKLCTNLRFILSNLNLLKFINFASFGTLHFIPSQITAYVHESFIFRSSHWTICKLAVIERNTPIYHWRHQLHNEICLLVPEWSLLRIHYLLARSSFQTWTTNLVSVPNADGRLIQSTFRCAENLSCKVA